MIGIIDYDAGNIRSVSSFLSGRENSCVPESGDTEKCG